MNRWQQIRTVTLISCVALLGATASPAHASTARSAAALSTAGSIAYQHGGNIFVARPDGSARHQVTHRGQGTTYSSATQADNGTIEALHGNTIVHLDRNGKSLGPSTTVATGPSNNFSLHTLAFSPAISPNGQTAAVSVLEYQGVYDPTTGVKGANIIAQTIQYFSTSSGKRISQRQLAGTYLESPSWIDNNHLLMFAPYNISAAQVYVDGPKLDGWDWFHDPESGDFDFDRQALNSGELSPKHDLVALIRGNNLKNDWRSTAVKIYTVTDLRTPPTPLCSYPAQHGALSKVTWSPDGTTLAWSDSNGLWETPVDPTAANCGLAPKLVIRGGYSPDWGPTGVSR
jgi:hypothetical protein